MPALSHAFFLPAVVASLTLGIFLLDAFTPLTIAIAVLYGAVILIASPVWPRGRIIALAVLCLALTMIAYAIGHSRDFFGPSLGRCLVSMAAIAITTVLALRNQHVTNRLREREEALRAANHRKDEFLAMLAHELRNPLAPISAGAHLLKVSPSDPRAVANVSEIIIRQTDHLSELINDLLDVSRVTRLVASLKRERVDMKQVVSDAAEQVRPLIESLGHRFVVDLPDEATIVFGDYKRLVQVVANLLNNAAKYTPEGGTLSLRLHCVSRQIVLEVRDSGIGIPDDLLAQMFELFTQADRHSDRSQGGLGIGLALVKALVELHGGSVAARNNDPQPGTTFTITLNVHEESQALGMPDGQAAPPSSMNALRILIVDDNIDAANMLASFLRTAGHVAEVCHRPIRAVERATEQAYDAFVLDIGLPEMDGNALARRLKQLPPAEKALYIAITGYGEQFNRQTAIRAGFDHYLVKPANPLALLKLLEPKEQSPAADQLPQHG